MKPLAYGAVLALVWLLFGAPLVTITTLLPVLVKPVTIAFVLGVLARPHVARRRWSR
jgi:fumarate reductase subunit D